MNKLFCTAFLCAFLSSAGAMASETCTDVEAGRVNHVPQCQTEALKALEQKLSRNPHTISYLGGAKIGDGGLVYEVFFFSTTDLAGNPIPYQVRFATDSADMCDRRPSDATVERLKSP